MNGPPQPPERPPRGYTPIDGVDVLGGKALAFALILVGGALWGVWHGIFEVAQAMFGYAWEPRWYQTLFVALVGIPFLQRVARRSRRGSK